MDGRGKHIKSIDGLRGIAALGVVFFHIMPETVTGGFLGVVTFLVLAGFLTMRKVILQGENNCRKGVFSQMKDRIKKIYPPLIAMIFVVVIYLYFAMSEYLPGLKYQAISGLLSVNNIAQIINGESYFEGIGLLKPLTHLWALSLEMQAYLLFYLLVGKRYRKEDKDIWNQIFFGLSVVSFLLMNALYHTKGDTTRVYYGLDTRMFSFFLGAMTANIYYNYDGKEIPRFVRTGIGFLTLSVSIAAFFFLENSMEMYRYKMLAYTGLICILILSVVEENVVSKFLKNPFLEYLGKRSYSIYLWHFPVVGIMTKQLAYTTLDYPAVIAAELIVSFVLAEISYQLFEVKRYHWEMFIAKVVTLPLMLIAVLIFPYVAHGSGVEKLKALEEIQNAVETEDGTLKEADGEISDATTSIDLQDDMEREDPVDSGNDKYVAVEEEDKTEDHLRMDRVIAELNEKYPEAAIDLELYAKYRYAEVSLIGDSMTTISGKFIKEYLPNLVIDGKGCRQMDQAAEPFENLKNNGLIGDGIVLALGTNGDVNPTDIDSIRDNTDVPVILTSIILPYQGQEKKRNDSIYEYAEKHRNVYLADWHKYCKGDQTLFAEDDIHPNAEGARTFGFLITGAVIDALEGSRQEPYMEIPEQFLEYLSNTGR